MTDTKSESANSILAQHQSAWMSYVRMGYSLADAKELAAREVSVKEDLAKAPDPKPGKLRKAPRNNEFKLAVRRQQKKYEERAAQYQVKCKANKAKAKKYRSRPRVDHLGRKYESFEALCKFYGIGAATCSRRLKKRWSLERCLTTPAVKGHHKSVTDPNGRTFNSIKKMCNAWHVEYRTYINRRARGSSMKTALRPSFRKMRGLFKELEAFVKE